MAKNRNVSLSVIRRLPRYYRFLGMLLDSGFSRISSTELSLHMGLTASQIRQDLNCFGGFGQQGYGYNVGQLREKIGGILGLDKGYPVIILGAGNIGRALANNMKFPDLGFRLCAIFDIDPEVIGQRMATQTVRDISELDEFCLQAHPKVAVMTLPTAAAPPLVDKLWQHGVTAFWNYTTYDIVLKYPQAEVENVHLGDSIMTLCYMIKEDCDGEA
ncbi:MAG: redox-sensing transcriptional repressor Rex [Clostridia bacterium]|nr:redox-sensing transcriptional repressor Rex [Clostridia bacterium]